MSSPTSSPDPEPAGAPEDADRSTTDRQSAGTDSPAEPPATAPAAAAAAAPAAGAAPISAAQLAELVGQLGRAAIDPDARRAWAAAEQAELINVIDQLERLNSARAALQATTTDAFTRTHTHARTGRTPTSTRKQDLLRRSINSQIALARHDSPVHGSKHVGLARALVHEMPHLHHALAAGQTSEYRAILAVRETALLSRDHRSQVDQALADQYPQLGNRRTATEAARHAYRLDPEQAVRRHAKAVTDRRVTLRPAPDTMTYLTALLPVQHGVAAYAALTTAADTTTATGDPRSRGQLMADTLIARLTGTTGTTGTGIADPTPAPTGEAATGTSATDSTPAPTDEPRTTTGEAATGTGTGAADATSTTTTEDDATPTDEPDTVPADHSDRPHPAADPTGTVTDHADRDPADTPLPAVINLDIQLVMTDRTLLDGDPEPAHLIGYGAIPAPLARRLVADADLRTRTWIRRLYTDPITGHLIDGDSKRRQFSDAARAFITARDQTCRTPWCDAPIRHIDHVTGRAAGGPTTLTNGQGLCAACNQIKEADGWRHRPDADRPGQVRITTPTGHTHTSRPPSPPRSAPWPTTESRPEPQHEPQRADRPVHIEIYHPKQPMYYDPDEVA